MSDEIASHHTKLRRFEGDPVHDEEGDSEKDPPPKTLDDKWRKVRNQADKLLDRKLETGYYY